jgi:hypothetical protein
MAERVKKRTINAKKTQKSGKTREIRAFERFGRL